MRRVESPTLHSFDNSQLPTIRIVLKRNFISNEYLDTMDTHFSGKVRKYFLPVLNRDTEHGIWQSFSNRTDDYRLFLLVVTHVKMGVQILADATDAVNPLPLRNWIVGVSILSFFTHSPKNNGNYSCAHHVPLKMQDKKTTAQTARLFVFRIVYYRYPPSTIIFCPVM